MSGWKAGERQKFAMFRIAAILLSAFATLFAAPVSAQSLALVSLPVVYVSSPVVQSTHQGKAIAPAAQVRPMVQPRAELPAGTPLARASRGRPELLRLNKRPRRRQG